ncbi:putative nucleotidyltransferase, ribonuclease H [Tanacetum coccineum]
MPPRKNRTLNEIHEQKLEDHVMARKDERFDQFFDQLSDRMDQLMNRRGRRPRQNQREDNRHWKSGIRVNIPDFAGDTLSLKGFIDWLIAVEEVVEDSEIPEAMIRLLEEFSNVFPDELPDGLPPLRDIQHDIDLEPRSQLPNRPHYRMSSGKHKELRRQVEELVFKGHARESISLCTVPALLTPKKDGTWRMCVDSRAINKITMRYRFHIPCLDELLDQISSATIFTKLDLKIRYYQIRLRPGDEWKTTFKTREGLPFIGKFVVVYFNDILIYSDSFNKHVTHVRQVLTLLWKDSFYAATKKCVFMTPKVLFLGYVVSGDGIQVDESKVAVVQEWLTPTTITDVQNCMKGKSFVWTEEAELAFQVVKEKLTTSPILILPDFSKVFELHTDASKAAIGGVLSQVVQAVKHWCHYLFHKEFVLFTDHDSLRHIHILTKPLKHESFNYLRTSWYRNDGTHSINLLCPLLLLLVSIQVRVPFRVVTTLILHLKYFKHS